MHSMSFLLSEIDILGGTYSQEYIHAGNQEIWQLPIFSIMQGGYGSLKKYRFVVETT